MDPRRQQEPSWLRQVLREAAVASVREQGHQRGASSTRPPPSGTDGGSSVAALRDQDATPVDLWIGGIGSDDSSHDDDERELRTGFQRRLATFGPANYFGRPPSLSPVVCARFGWNVRQIDQLVCEECGACWNVPFPAIVTRTLHLSLLYEEELCSRHKNACRYRCQARLHRDEMIRSCRDLDKPMTRDRRLAWRGVLPSAMEPLLLTRATRRLLRYPPLLVMDRFRGHYRLVLHVLAASLPRSDTMTWLWTLPDAVQEYRPENDAFFLATDGVEGDRPATHPPESAPPRVTLLQRIIVAMQTDVGGYGTDVSSVPQPNQGSQLEELAVALLLFGWSDSLLLQFRGCESSSRMLHRSVITTNRSAARDTWRLACPFTLSILELVAVNKTASSASSSEGNHPTAKASNRNNVAKAHRYYSPYVCGFPFTWSLDDRGNGANPSTNPSTSPTLPIWKALAARLLLSTKPVHDRTEGPKRLLPAVAENPGTSAPAKPYDSYEQAVHVLRSALSPGSKRRRPTIQAGPASHDVTIEQRL